MTSPILNEGFYSGAFLVREAPGFLSRDGGVMANPSGSDAVYPGGLVCSLNATFPTTATAAPLGVNTGNGTFGQILVAPSCSGTRASPAIPRHRRRRSPNSASSASSPAAQLPPSADRRRASPSTFDPKEAAHVSDRTLTITLDPPIEHEGGKIASLRLREPTGGEMRDAEKKLDGGVNAESASAFQVAVVGAVSGLSSSAIDKLPVSVMRRAHDFTIAFDAGAARGEAEMPSAPSLDVPLPEPMTVDGVAYAAISLSEPTVGMRRRAESALRTGVTTAAMRQYQLILVAQASGIPFAAVEKLPVSALNRAETFLRGFIAPGPVSGSA